MEYQQEKFKGKLSRCFLDMADFHKSVWIFNHYATDMFENKGGRHYWFAENLLHSGYTPVVFCANTFHNSNKQIDTGNKKYKIDKSDDFDFVFVKTTQYHGNGLSRILNMCCFYKNLFTATKLYSKKNGKPDIIIASSVHPFTMLAGIQIAKKCKVPCICEIRDLWPEAVFLFNKVKENSVLGRILVKSEHWIYKNADSLIFTKEGDIDYIKERKWDSLHNGDINLDKAHYINNGVDISKFNKLRFDKVLVDEDLNNDRFNVVYVGAIRPINNVGNILDAAELLKEYKEIQFLVFGDGSERNILEKRVVDEKLFNVKIKGFVNKQYIPYILNNSSVNILNYSQTEYNWSRGNSSNKLFEYMASGKPIISTVKMGYSIIDKYKCGVELEDGSPRFLADAILKIKNMSSNKYDELGNNAKRGAEDFDFKILTRKLINVIENTAK